MAKRKIDKQPAALIDRDCGASGEFYDTPYWADKLWFCMLTNTVEGRIRADPEWLRDRHLLKRDRRRMPAVGEVAEILATWVRHGMLRGVVRDKVKYYEITRWHLYQATNAPPTNKQTNKQTKGRDPPSENTDEEPADPDQPCPPGRTYRQHDRHLAQQEEQKERELKQQREEEYRRYTDEQKANAMSPVDFQAAVRDARAKLGQNGGET